VWLERKIAAKIHGDKYLDFEAVGGYKDLQDAVNSMPEQFTSLVLPIGDNNPDDAYSTIAYEKGFNLLLYLERKVGTEKFEKLFQAYIKEFGSRTLSSETFKEFFQGYFSKDKNATSAIQDVDWDTWYYKPGLPPTIVDFDRSLSHASEQLAQEWLHVDRSNAPIPKLDVQAWSSHQMTCFLDELISLTSTNQPLKCSTLQLMNALYGFASSRNAEILLRYCRLAIAAEDKSVLPVVTRFITSQGRMKFIRPLYKALYASEMGKDLAVETFLRNKDFYHPIGAKMVASDLLLKLRDNACTKSKMVDYIKVVTAVSAVAVGIILVLQRRKQR
jgi:leukotriene-A4 hydrolase